MAISQYKGGGGILGSTAAKVGIGFATGGPAGAGVALLSANNPAAGKVASLGAQAAKPDASAMERRMDVTDVDDPKQVIQDGLDALMHPDISPEMRADLAVPLLQAKHYGRAV